MCLLSTCEIRSLKTKRSPITYRKSGFLFHLFECANDISVWNASASLVCNTFPNELLYNCLYSKNRRRWQTKKHSLSVFDAHTLGTCYAFKLTSTNSSRKIKVSRFLLIYIEQTLHEISTRFACVCLDVQLNRKCNSNKNSESDKSDMTTALLCSLFLSIQLLQFVIVRCSLVVICS